LNFLPKRIVTDFEYELTLTKDSSEKYDKLSEKDRDKVLLHEIVHIPRNFSGSLVPHYRKGKRNFHNQVDVLVKKYMKIRRKNK